MSGTWSKEDRHSFERSEVMQGLETKILDTIRRADVLREKFAADTAEKIKTDADSASESVANLTDKVQELNAVTQNGACDGEVNSHEAKDDEVADDSLKNEVIDDLRGLAAAAISDGNIKLAYRIERTIDEIAEQDVTCI